MSEDSIVAVAVLGGGVLCFLIYCWFFERNEKPELPKSTFRCPECGISIKTQSDEGLTQAIQIGHRECPVKEVSTWSPG